MILPDGKILVSGIVTIASGGSPAFAVFRFNGNGSPNTSFGITVLSQPPGVTGAVPIMLTLERCSPTAKLSSSVI